MVFPRFSIFFKFSINTSFSISLVLENEPTLEFGAAIHPKIRPIETFLHAKHTLQYLRADGSTKLEC